MYDAMCMTDYFCPLIMFDLKTPTVFVEITNVFPIDIEDHRYTLEGVAMCLSNQISE